MAAKVIVPGLAGRMRAAREAAGMTQVAAAERSGVHRISIMKFETERTVPTLDVLYRLAAAYGVNVCELLPGGVLPDAPAEPPPPSVDAAEPPAGARKPGRGGRKRPG